MKNFRKKDNTLIIMCGLPGSGKSTMAKKFQRNLELEFVVWTILEKKFMGTFVTRKMVI